MDSKNLMAVVITFLVAAIGLTFAFNLIFDSYAMSIGPAIAVAVGIAGVVYFSQNKSRSKSADTGRER